MSFRKKNTDAPRAKKVRRQVELCSLCGNYMRLPDEDKIAYDYSLPEKFTGVCSSCADIRNHSL